MSGSALTIPKSERPRKNFEFKNTPTNLTCIKRMLIAFAFQFNVKFVSQKNMQISLFYSEHYILQKKNNIKLY